MAAAEKRVAPRGKIGRPSKFDAAFVDQAFRYALLGATDEEMAGFFDISVPTFYAWQKQHPAFLKALQRGKVEADATVAESLYKRANGYSHQAVKIHWDKDGNEYRAQYVEHYPPDTGSAIFWLKNRQRGKWRDRQDLDVSGETTVKNETTIAIADLAPEQRDQLRAILLGTKRAPTITDVEHEEAEDE